MVVCLTGFSPDVVSHLPHWGGNVRWHAIEREPYDYQFSIQQLSNATYRGVTLSIAHSQHDPGHQVELKIAGTDEQTILQLLSHCLLLPAVHDGLIGIDYADFVTALLLARTGVLVGSTAVDVGRTITELEGSILTAGIDPAGACATALCRSHAAIGFGPDLDLLLQYLNQFGNDSALHLPAAVQAETSEPQTTLLILH